ncbi:hypothetical protein ACVIIV_001899 [Bradyrhizobium sp. USDA 4354]
MTNVFYFARYSQQENFATNNTLLLMYRLYEESRRRFQEFLTKLLDETADAPITALGLQMKQQEPSGKSVLDGFLYQDAVRIGIEAKGLGVEFDGGQLLNHLDRFDKSGSGYLLLLRPDKVDLTDQAWKELLEQAKKRRVIVSSITFQQIIDSFKECLRPHDDNLIELIDDFEAFCSEHRLLGTDDVTIFVPPCGQSFDINIKHKLYFCPSDWSRRNVKYLGLYKDKSVQYLGQITRIVHCERIGQQLVTLGADTAPLSHSEQLRVSAAMDDARTSTAGWDISVGHKFFLCEELLPTAFNKSSRGGIMGHRYLNLQGYLPAARRMSLAEIGAALNGKTWA